MPVGRSVLPTHDQVRALQSLYELTKQQSDSPSYFVWREQIIRQGQWNAATISNVILQLRARRVRRNAAARPVTATITVPSRVQQAVERLTASADGAGAAMRALGDAASDSRWVDGHHLIDGTVYHVHPLRSRARAARYPEGREVHSLDLGRLTGTGRASWRFRARAYQLSEQRRYGSRLPVFTVATLMTPERIAEFGAMHGFCGICGRTLTVSQSVERGVGPVCWRRVVEYRNRQNAADVETLHGMLAESVRGVAENAPGGTVYLAETGSWDPTSLPIGTNYVIVSDEAIGDLRSEGTRPEPF